MGPLIITRLWSYHKDPFRKKKKNRIINDECLMAYLSVCWKGWRAAHLKDVACPLNCNKYSQQQVKRSRGLRSMAPWFFDWQLLQCFFRKLEFSYAFTCMNAVALDVFTDWTVEGLDNLKILVSLLSLR